MTVVSYSSNTEGPFKFQSDTIILILSLATSRLHEIKWVEALHQSVCTSNMNIVVCILYLLSNIAVRFDQKRAAQW